MFGVFILLVILVAGVIYGVQAFKKKKEWQGNIQSVNENLLRYEQNPTVIYQAEKMARAIRYVLKDLRPSPHDQTIQKDFTINISPGTGDDIFGSYPLDFEWRLSDDNIAPLKTDPERKAILRALATLAVEQIHLEFETTGQFEGYNIEAVEGLADIRIKFRAPNPSYIPLKRL